jgi:tRNA nucleotidyltransferase (CCA-adding enzyme)
MTVRLYEVGGCVRDSLMGRTSKDIDYSVEAESYDAMRSYLETEGFKIFVENPEFLTIRAQFPKSAGKRVTADFVLARREGGYTDGRRPDEVFAGSLKDDLARRDFTMNAIARDQDGNLIDPFNGSRDIVNGLIKAVGNAHERINEDALRGLRAIRFAVTLGFQMDKDLEAVLGSRHFAPLLTSVSVERVREELEKAFAHDTVQTLEWLSFFNLNSTVFSRGLRLSATMKG